MSTGNKFHVSLVMKHCVEICEVMRIYQLYALTVQRSVIGEAAHRSKEKRQHKMLVDTMGGCMMAGNHQVTKDVSGYHGWAYNGRESSGNKRC